MLLGSVPASSSDTLLSAVRAFMGREVKGNTYVYNIRLQESKLRFQEMSNQRENRNVTIATH